MEPASSSNDLQKKLVNHKNSKNLLTFGSHCMNSVMIRMILSHFSIDCKSGRERKWILYQHKRSWSDLNSEYSLNERGSYLHSPYVFFPWHSKHVHIVFLNRMSNLSLYYCIVIIPKYLLRTHSVSDMLGLLG